MLNSFLIILTLGFLIGLLEKIYPNQKLQCKQNWLYRALFLIFLRLVLVMVGQYTWEVLIGGKYSCLNLKVSSFNGGLIAYLINSWIFYWWHRLRNESTFFWR